MPTLIKSKLCLLVLLFCSIFIFGQTSNTVFLSENLLVIGDPNYESRDNTYSAVIVYKKTTSGWKFIHRIKPPEGFESDYFGEKLFAIDNEIFVTDKTNNRVYHYKVGNKKVNLLRIYTSFETSETAFGKNITGNKSFILVASQQIPDAFSKSKGLVHVFKRTDSTLLFLQTFYPITSEQTGFGNEMVILNDHTILISSNNSRNTKKQGAINAYLYDGKGWGNQQIIKTENAHRKDGFGDVFCVNSTSLFVRNFKKGEQGSPVIEVYETSNGSTNKTQELPKPKDIPIDGFAQALAASENKLYATFHNKKRQFGVLVYDLNCVDEWKLVQRIVPDFKNDTVTLSISARNQTLAIGTKKSQFNTYFDVQALSDGKVKLYEYHPDSTQIASLTEIREDFYISPSGDRHLYSHKFYDTIQNKNGCDSIIHIDLTILKTNEDLSIDTVTPITPFTEDREERSVKNLDTIIVDNELIYFTLHDHGQFDQDTISIKLNDSWVIFDEEVTKIPKHFYLLGKPGVNRLLIRAENEGKEPPNTVTISGYNSNQELILKKHINSSLKESSALYIRIQE